MRFIPLKHRLNQKGFDALGSAFFPLNESQGVPDLCGFAEQAGGAIDAHMQVTFRVPADGSPGMLALQVSETDLSRVGTLGMWVPENYAGPYINLGAVIDAAAGAVASRQSVLWCGLLMVAALVALVVARDIYHVIDLEALKNALVAIALASFGAFFILRHFLTIKQRRCVEGT